MIFYGSFIYGTIDFLYGTQMFSPKRKWKQKFSGIPRFFLKEKGHPVCFRKTITFLRNQEKISVRRSRGGTRLHRLQSTDYRLLWNTQDSTYILICVHRLIMILRFMIILYCRQVSEDTLIQESSEYYILYCKSH